MQGVTYSVEIVLCIDCTGSMGSLIESVKKNALKFYEDLTTIMQEKGKVINELRVKVIEFRDYYVDGERAMAESAFFLLPAQREEYSRFLQSLRADGGGDEPENGLEAVALAIRSEWSKTAHRRRQIIVVWTDASTHPLEKNAGAKGSNYPTGMPRNFNELTDLWEGQEHMGYTSKRLIVYAPDAFAWTDIATHWENTLHYPSKAGAGLSDVDYRSIVDVIANSV